MGSYLHCRVLGSGLGVFDSTSLEPPSDTGGSFQNMVLYCGAYKMIWTFCHKFHSLLGYNFKFYYSRSLFSPYNWLPRKYYYTVEHTYPMRSNYCVRLFWYGPKGRVGKFGDCLIYSVYDSGFGHPTPAKLTTPFYPVSDLYEHPRPFTGLWKRMVADNKKTKEKEKKMVQTPAFLFIKDLPFLWPKSSLTVMLYRADSWYIDWWSVLFTKKERQKSEKKMLG